MPGFRPSATAVALVTLAVACTCSCTQDEWPALFRTPDKPNASGDQGTATDALTAPAGQTTSESDRPVVIQGVRFQVLRVRAPVGTFSRSEKIWNALDEDVLPMDHRALLAKNGLRIAVAGQDVWPQIKAILDAEPVEVFSDHRAVHDGFPLPLLINTELREQTLFLIRPDNTMAGARFSQATMTLRLAYAVPLDAPQSLELEITPEVRLPSYRPAPTVTKFGWTEHPSVEQGRPLWELASQVTVGPEQFVVVGPSSAVGTPHLAGTLLLCEQINSRDFESICFITPSLQRVEAGEGNSK